MEAASATNLRVKWTGTLTNGMENWIAKAKAGDQEAYRSIYERFVRPLGKFVFDMVGHSLLVEDLVQETFVRAFRNLSSLRDESKISTWLFGIARNVCLEALRRREMDPKRVGMEDEIVQQVRDENPPPEGAVLNRELNGVLQRALESLDLDKKQVFILKILHGCSYEEISQVTGFSIPKLKTDLHRARAEMRVHLRPYLEVEDGV